MGLFPLHQLDAIPAQSLTKGALQLVIHALVDAYPQIEVGAVSREGHVGLSSREVLLSAVEQRDSSNE